MDATQAGQTVGLVESVVEGAVPVLAPFHPLIALVSTAIIAHFLATKTWPTEEQIRAAIPGAVIAADYLKLTDTWAAWKPSGDGSLVPKPAA